MSKSNVIDEDFNRLRKILAKPTTDRLDHLEQRLDFAEECSKDPPTAENVSAVLPEAVRIGVRKGPELVTALAPVVESALDQSIARNKEKLSNALYPLLGAMVRKYVVEGLRDSVESLNIILARALSAEGMKWRFESFRTGVPVSQIAFRHSMVFRAEHVFLVHNKTAQPLFHLSVPDAIEADQLVFAGMIGAITDFVKDAFFRKEPIGLRSIGVGGLTVWFEEGPLATIALVIRGEPRPFLRSQLRRVSEKLHDQYPLELQNAMVDEVSLMSYDSALRPTLLQEPREARKKMERLGRAATAILATALVALGVFGLNNFLNVRDRDARFGRLISQVRSNEDVLITDYGKSEGGKYFVAGVTAPNASAVLPVEDFGFKPDEVDVRLDSHLFDPSVKEAELQKYSDQLRQLDGTPWPADGSPSRAWLESTTNRIADLYLLGHDLDRPFIVVIEHPGNLKAAADKLSGQIAWRLYLQGIYDRHLIRTLPVNKQGGVIRALQERTVGN